jgi:hypothetical protein
MLGVEAEVFGNISDLVLRHEALDFHPLFFLVRIPLLLAEREVWKVK